MTEGIDLYRTDDYVPAGRISMTPVLREAFEPILGDLRDARFNLTFLPIADRRELPGEPSVVNLRHSHGYVVVRIERGGTVVYQHPHAVREVLGRPLQVLLRRRTPQETHWGFGVSGPGLEQMGLTRPAPHPVGGGKLRMHGPRRLHIEPVTEPEPPEADLAMLGVPAAPAGESPDPGGLVVVLGADVHAELVGGLAFSEQVEEGGFLLGHVFRDRHRPSDTLVRIVRAQPAERTGASFLQFTFTGESFLRVNQTIARQAPARGDGWVAPLRLVGWYHTHLFPATDSLGLSSIDDDLHASTFRHGWQVAALVNAHNGRRELRVYRRDGAAMRQIPYRIGPAWTP